MTRSPFHTKRPNPNAMLCHAALSGTIVASHLSLSDSLILASRVSALRRICCATCARLMATTRERRPRSRDASRTTTIHYGTQNSNAFRLPARRASPPQCALIYTRCAQLSRASRESFECRWSLRENENNASLRDCERVAPNYVCTHTFDANLCVCSVVAPVMVVAVVCCYVVGCCEIPPCFCGQVERWKHVVGGASDVQ